MKDGMYKDLLCLDPVDNRREAFLLTSPTTYQGN
jgi:hypothetical protein